MRLDTDRDLLLERRAAEKATRQWESKMNLFKWLDRGLRLSLVSALLAPTTSVAQDNSGCDGLPDDALCSP